MTNNTTTDAEFSCALLSLSCRRVLSSSQEKVIENLFAPAEESGSDSISTLDQDSRNTRRRGNAEFCSEDLLDKTPFCAFGPAVLESRHVQDRTESRGEATRSEPSLHLAIPMDSCESF